MQLDCLVVAHRLKAASPAQRGRAGFDVPAGALRIETCLRELVLMHADTARALPDTHVCRGTDAYDLLLRIACGLESEIVGESDVLGQFKQSWQTHRKQHPLAARWLESLMQHLFEDAREVRSRHLIGLGGVTYGSLTRALLGEHADEPTLLIGAGQMAQAVLPYLLGRPLLIANRTPEHTRRMVKAALPEGRATDGVRLLSADEELAGWAEVPNVVVCVPADAERDRARVAAWNTAHTPRGRLIHLGILSTKGTAWNTASVSTLGDLFALQSAGNDRRRTQHEHARAACRERAQLRTLGGPLNLAHGWEDLSLFANIA